MMIAERSKAAAAAALLVVALLIASNAGASLGAPASAGKPVVSASAIDGGEHGALFPPPPPPWRPIKPSPRTPLPTPGTLPHAALPLALNPSPIPISPRPKPFSHLRLPSPSPLPTTSPCEQISQADHTSQGPSTALSVFEAPQKPDAPISHALNPVSPPPPPLSPLPTTSPPHCEQNHQADHTSQVLPLRYQHNDESAAVAAAMLALPHAAAHALMLPRMPSCCRACPHAAAHATADIMMKEQHSMLPIRALLLPCTCFLLPPMHSFPHASHPIPLTPSLSPHPSHSSHPIPLSPSLSPHPSHPIPLPPSLSPHSSPPMPLPPCLPPMRYHPDNICQWAKCRGTLHMHQDETIITGWHANALNPSLSPHASPSNPSLSPHASPPMPLPPTHPSPLIPLPPCLSLHVLSSRQHLPASQVPATLQPSLSPPSRLSPSLSPLFPSPLAISSHHASLCQSFILTLSVAPPLSRCFPLLSLPRPSLLSSLPLLPSPPTMHLCANHSFSPCLLHLPSPDASPFSPFPVPLSSLPFPSCHLLPPCISVPIIHSHLVCCTSPLPMLPPSLPSPSLSPLFPSPVAISSHHASLCQSFILTLSVAPPLSRCFPLLSLPRSLSPLFPSPVSISSHHLLCWKGLVSSPPLSSSPLLFPLIYLLLVCSMQQSPPAPQLC
ncbi:unnamed protein product [Closterium sp. NIES-64]|nr:unnamed protein product [Closterium sp. NIES-64]